MHSYKLSFFPYATLEWNKLDKNTYQSKTTPKPIYNIYKQNTTSLKLVSAIFMKFLFFHQMITLQKL